MIEVALEAYVERWKGVPFEYGKHDCVRFAAGWLDFQLGTQFTRDIERAYPYRNEKDAIRILACARGLQQLVEAKLGSPVAPLTLRSGDIALIDQDEFAIGVRTPSQVIGPSREGGVVALALNFVVCGWSIANLSGRL